MNKIEAIIRPERLNIVKDALAAAGIVGLNITQVSGRGAQKGIEVGGPRGVGAYTVDMLPKVKLEVVVTDGDTQKAVDIIVENSQTGTIGDGKMNRYLISRCVIAGLFLAVVGGCDRSLAKKTQRHSSKKQTDSQPRKKVSIAAEAGGSGIEPDVGHL